MKQIFTERTDSYLRIKVSKYNSEGYYSPTEYEGMMNILREEYEKEQERKRKKVFMPKVFICSPFRGEVYKNILNAKKYCRFAVDSGYIPFAPHLFFPRFLSDENEYERNLGIKMGKVFLDDCRELWWFGDTITEGMQIEIDRAKHRKLTIRHFTVNLEEVKE
ncbi:MAG: hypothetical protein IKJ10_02420 [Bacteroidaceae bacterium]|nr:hypothetical protein [Bacteroidaceae bacterium]